MLIETATLLSQNLRMTGRRKRYALAALLATLLPWTTATTLSIHFTDEHAAPHADLAAALHGHAHPDGTPDHDHSLMPLPTTACGRPSVVLVRFLRAELLAIAGDALAPMSLARPRPRETASPPAASRSPGSVLRI